MRLNLTQLNHSLKKELKAIYLLSGDEPLQLGEAADSIRFTAKKAGYLNREVFTVEGNFKWNQITEATESISIFADKQIIDLRVPNGKFGKEGAKIITEYCQQPPSDTLLLISSGKLASSSLKTRWVKSVEKLGVLIQIWSLTGADLMTWLQQRALKRGLQLERESIKILASRIEGNLLAASQEIEKLYVLYGAGALTIQQVEAAVTDSSRFDVFNLSDAVLSGRVNRITKILQGLQAEGVAAPIILWALTRELRCLLELKISVNKEIIFRKYHIWDKRKQLINKALTRLNLAELQQAMKLSALADRQIKGQQAGDSWETLLKLCLLMGAVKVFSFAE